MYSLTGSHLHDFLYLMPVCAGLYLLRKWNRGGQFTENVSAIGKVAVVTGGNSGVGKALCELLNKRGAKVYMLCRDEKRAAQAKAKLVEDGCDPQRLIIRTGNLDDFTSIQAVAKTLLAEESRIDILINNAGVLGIPSFEKTVDGFERTWQSNHLGHFLLTELLLKSIKRSSDPRIVNVSSEIHSKGDTIDLDFVNDAKNYARMMIYARSKLANVMYSRELSHRHPRILSSSCHPGNINTNILATSGLIILKQIFAPIFWFCFKTEMDGAQTALYLALSQRLPGNGLYYSDCVVVEEAAIARDRKECEKLYEQSLNAVKEYL